LTGTTRLRTHPRSRKREWRASWPAAGRMTHYVHRMLEHSGGAQKRAEVKNIVNGRRPHCSLLWLKIRKPRNDRAAPMKPGLRGFGFQLLYAGRRSTVDGDAARLHGLGNFPYQLDLEQAVANATALHLDVSAKLNWHLKCRVEMPR
jgi:hypothetical protein